MKLRLTPMILFCAAALCVAQTRTARAEDEPKEDNGAYRFAGVQTWYGTISANTTVTKESKQKTSYEGYGGVREEYKETTETHCEFHASVQIPKEKSEDPQVGLSWGAPLDVYPPPTTGSGSMLYKYKVERNTHRSGQDVDETITTNGNGSKDGAVSDVQAQVSISPMDGYYSVMLSSGQAFPDLNVKYKTVRRYYDPSEKTYKTENSNSEEQSFAMPIGIENLSQHKVMEDAGNLAESMGLVDMAKQAQASGGNMTLEQLQEMGRRLDQFAAQTGTRDNPEVKAKLGQFKLPKTGQNLVGNYDSEYTNDDDPNVTTIVKQHVEWNLSPDKPVEYELVVDIDGYKDWIPSAGQTEDDPGKDLTVHLKLQDKEGREADFLPEKIVYTLSDISTEPGISMNYPVGKAKNEADLRFDPQKNPGAYIEKKAKDKYELTAGDIKKPMVVSPYDWGAYGTLKVEAHLDSGAVIVGHLKDKKDVEEIPIPERDPGSRIANAWKRDPARGAAGKADDDDSEDEPEGDGHKGDGLTLYEEYRGFNSVKEENTTQGHFYGDPKTKEYFFQDCVDNSIVTGVLPKFAEITKFKVHLMDCGDLGGDRVINANHGRGPHVVDQHAYMFRRFQKNTTDEGDQLGRNEDGKLVRPLEQDFSTITRTIGRVGTPAVAIGAYIGTYNLYQARHGDAAKKADFQTEIMHEMLHGASVWHHGERDLQKVTWEVDAENSSVIETDPRTGDWYHVRVYREPGPRDKELVPLDLTKLDKVTKIYVAVPGGQHSGDEDCIMRYAVASAYKPYGQPDDVRIYVGSESTEPYGTKLCTTRVGSALYMRRYSLADKDHKRGDCTHQLCINDRYKDAIKHDRKDHWLDHKGE